MNSSKSKHDLTEESEVKFTDIIPDNTSKKSAPASIADEQNMVSQEKSQEAAKKHQEFFGSTIFDDEKEIKEEKIEDDILNVPAFFRRRNG